jgi:hypothetical protein
MNKAVCLIILMFLAGCTQELAQESVQEKRVSWDENAKTYLADLERILQESTLPAGEQRLILWRAIGNSLGSEFGSDPDIQNRAIAAGVSLILETSEDGNLMPFGSIYDNYLYYNSFYRKIENERYWARCSPRQYREPPQIIERQTIIQQPQISRRYDPILDDRLLQMEWSLQRMEFQQMHDRTRGR